MKEPRWSFWGPLTVPEAYRSPVRRLAPLTVMCASCCAAVPLPAQHPPVLPDRASDDLVNYDITFEVHLNGQLVSTPPYKDLYWSPAQMLAHMTVNGATVRTGDLYASGTVSGPEKNQRGSFIELTWGGREPLVLDGKEHTFLEDGDEVAIAAWATTSTGTRLGLGEVTGKIVHA